MSCIHFINTTSHQLLVMRASNKQQHDTALEILSPNTMTILYNTAKTKKLSLGVRRIFHDVFNIVA